VVNDLAHVVRPFLKPRVGLRLGPEDGPVELEIDYYEATRTQLRGGTIRTPAHLTITLEWDDESSDSDEITVFIGRDVEVGLSIDTSRVLHLDGLIEDPNAWGLAPEVIGSDLWQKVMLVVDGRVSQTIKYEVNPDQLEEFVPKWLKLGEAARSGKITNMRSHPGARDEVLRILGSEPELMKRVFAKLDEQSEHGFQEPDKT
jgi:hypothetical protein